ncbi:methionyl-tRNA formyltransferase [Candidatus Pelagibacter bacterium]|nr:methionyl-tRNA formyltransferase [Candidatus Pelagibacter bacterium]
MVLNIIFMGTPDFAVPILKSINNLNHNILEVYTQPPNKKNRGQKIQNSPVHDYSNKLNLPVRCPIAFNEDEINHIKKLNPDLVIVVAYGKILPVKLLNLDKVLFINVHASLLPRWRGAAPIQRAIMNLDHETGVSIMKIVTELDAGPVLLQSKVKITKEINYKELSSQMSELGAKLILDTLKLIEDNKANFIEQNESKATYAKKIEKSETKISWNDDAEKIIAKINAFSPNPGCWFELNGSRVKVIKAKKIISEGIPGTILDDNLTIACSKNAIQIMEIKKEGKQKMTAKEFLRGNKIKTGQSLN